METHSYPNITEASLVPFRAIEIQLKGTPDLLDKPGCPYPPLIKAMLRRLVGGAEGVAVDTGSLLIDPAEKALDEEIAWLYQTVKTDSQNYSGSDMKDKMSFMKTASDLLTKLLGIQKERYNVRNMALMQRTVVECMEEFLTPGQRTEFIEKMGKFVNV